MEEKELQNMHVGKLIRMINHQLKRRQGKKEDSSESGLTDTQRHVLRFVLLASENRPLYQKDVEKEFQMRKSTVTGILQLMEKNGLITRENTQKDARLKQIVPTEKAESLRLKVRAHIRETEEKMAEGISEDDLLCCKQVLWKMFCNLSDEASKEEI